MGKSKLKNKKLEKPLKFHEKLVLNQWLLSLFEVASFDALTVNLKTPELEGFDEDNISKFHYVLRAQLFEHPELPPDLLLEYDQNIVRYWKRITEKRNLQGHILHPKYFQYLSLLFTEIYLDRYFRDPEKLLESLNQHVQTFNEWKQERDQIKPYELKDLNKIAYWNATGSGKTLITHINILQYKHYLEKNNRENELNRIILLTPNEGLSQQHLEEFKLSGIRAEIFSKDSRGLFSSGSVEIIEITKLRDEMGEKTVAVESFEGNNLVLVDEGHRGTSGKKIGVWITKRNQLCEDGFSFEYSATFGQAMKASGSKELEQTYTKCVLFDYSYKYFYSDGYGKDYRILNLADDSDEEIRQRYLTACLLAYYQQQKLYSERQKEFRPYLIERPLWIFVGGSVNAVRTQNRRKVSDVVDILLFMADFVKNRAVTVSHLEHFLKGQSGLLDAKGNELFSGAFTYLYKLGLSGDQVYEDILRVLFNSSSTAAIHVEHLKGSEGEIALRLGENEPFGLINVGDAPALCKLCDEQNELNVTDREFSGSLFHTLNESTSSINILIGSKKFSQGWNSWRVSTMGLMNIGKKEGSEIIQLFGRGVRLKGMNFSLKRSHRIPEAKPPDKIEILESLNIFGIRADYMRQFKEYLEDEGLPANEDRIEFVLPVIENLGKKKLKTIRLKEGVDFKKDGEKPVLDMPDDRLTKNPIVVDWYPKLQALSAGAGAGKVELAIKNEGKLEQKHISFMDINEIYFEMQQFKNERAWYNLNLSREKIYDLLSEPEWYRLFIPADQLEFRSFDQFRRWQEVALVLLKKYCDRYYKFRKEEFESDHLEYRELTPDDDNFIEEYLFLIEQSRDDIVDKLGELKELVESGKLSDFEFQNLRAINFNRHLYTPLVYVKSDFVEVKPVILETESERDFVLDLQQFCERKPDYFEGKELYLLRNLSRGRGIGFFEAGNFYPDFIIWLLVEGKQYISFVDPKGIRNLEGPNDPKIRFYKDIKKIETQLSDPEITLNSFIISNTPYRQVSWWSDGIEKKVLEKCHVLFQKDDKNQYIKKLLNKTLKS